ALERPTVFAPAVALGRDGGGIDVDRGGGGGREHGRPAGVGGGAAHVLYSSAKGRRALEVGWFVVVQDGGSGIGFCWRSAYETRDLLGGDGAGVQSGCRGRGTCGGYGVAF